VGTSPLRGIADDRHAAVRDTISLVSSDHCLWKDLGLKRMEIRPPARVIASPRFEQ